MSSTERFENAWWDLVEAFVDIGEERSLGLLDKIIAFHYANSRSGDAGMIKQIKSGLRDWYNKPEQRRPEKKE